jgi:hypothetical protein
MLVIIPAAVSVLMGAGYFGDRFWGNASDSRVTSYQVAQLTSAVRDLASKFDGMAKQSSMDALSARVDHDDGQISDLYNLTTGLRHDLDNRLPAPVYRNPQK